MRLVLTITAALYLSTLALAATQQPTPFPATQRFDMEVRADFFAGFGGASERLERAMKRCEEVLAMDANYAEALVWHGSGLLFQAGMAFQKGDSQKGAELWGKGLTEMDRAVGLSPTAVAVRIPRGATLIEVSRTIPNQDQAQALLRVAVEDYEHALTLQQPYFSTLSEHARSELLFGLAYGWARLEERDKASAYFKRILNDAPASGRSTYAKAWLAGTPPKDPGRCVGCH